MAEFQFPSNPNFTTTETDIEALDFPVEEFDSSGEVYDQIDDGYVYYLASQGDHRETFGYYDEIFGPMFDSFFQTWRVNPPAAKELTVVEFTAEELSGRDSIICAVCTFEFVAYEKLCRLPCQHHYHKECIARWLRNRNTCPLCRHELLTDKAEEDGGAGGRGATVLW